MGKIKIWTISTVSIFTKLDFQTFKIGKIMNFAWTIQVGIVYYLFVIRHFGFGHPVRLHLYCICEKVKRKTMMTTREGLFFPGT